MMIVQRRMLDLQRIRGIANYQFGRNMGEDLFPNNVSITYSKRTGRIRFIYLNEELLATLRPTDGLLTLTLTGAERLRGILRPPKLRVVVDDEAEKFVARGRSVFAKHVVEADPEIRPKEEVLVTNRKDNVLAVGRALLAGGEMLAFKRGVAVKIRRGAKEG